MLIKYIKQLFEKKAADSSKALDRLEAVKLNPNLRLRHDQLSDQQKFTDATRYGTYQINGLDVDF